MGMGVFVDLQGTKFGRLTVIGSHLRRPYRGNGQNRTFWPCVCSCGNSCEIASGQLMNGTAQSCGCLRAELSRARRETHGESGSREHRIWKGLKRRCCDPNNPAYKGYGGRGIALCPRWQGENGFVNFLADMGKCPSPKHTLDRFPDKNGDYKPSNCRWATMLQQGRNSRKNRLVAHDGEILPISVWAERTGINRSTIQERLNRGWTATSAITTPVKRRKQT